MKERKENMKVIGWWKDENEKCCKWKKKREREWCENKIKWQNLKKRDGREV